MKGYTATIINTSKELSKKESVLIKDLSNAVALDAVTSDGEHIQFKPAFYAELSIHNENAREKDYPKYILVDEDGTKYITGSRSFWDSFLEIMGDMYGSDEEWMLDVYKLPSKKYQGKAFLTCSII